MPATDCHFHIFAAHVAESGARYVPSYSASLAAWKSAAARLGVSHGVVVQPSFLGTNATQLLAALKAEPQALRGVAVVSPDISTQHLLDLYSAGVRAARLNLFKVPDALAVVRALPAQWWGALMAANFHVELHADHGQLAALIPNIPSEISLVLDHFGRPTSCDELRAIAQAIHARKQTFVTLSGSYRQAKGLSIAGLAQQWRDAIGSDHLLWASDWPCTNFEAHADFAALVAERDAWCAFASIETETLHRNAQRLYWR